jgi:hypothetical protein
VAFRRIRFPACHTGLDCRWFDPPRYSSQTRERGKRRHFAFPMPHNILAAPKCAAVQAHNCDARDKFMRPVSPRELRLV